MFSLESQKVTLAHLNVRPENHGDEKVGGAAALIQVEKRACRGVILHDYELAPIRVGVNTIDGLLGKLDVIKLNYARMRLNAMQTQGA